MKRALWGVLELMDDLDTPSDLIHPDQKNWPRAEINVPFPEIVDQGR